jgi:hypothetical protein
MRKSRTPRKRNFRCWDRWTGSSPSSHAVHGRHPYIFTSSQIHT